MRNLVVLGAGTAGTMVANRLRRLLPRDLWRITVVEREDWHVYQPGLLFVPFGAAGSRRPVLSLLGEGIEVVLGEIDRVDTARGGVLVADGRWLPYDQLVIATGVQPRPDLTPGMLGPHWRSSIFDFYTPAGAEALCAALRRFDGGRIVVHIGRAPIKAPVAPLEFCFLAADEFRRRGIRDRVELAFVTPQAEAFPKHVAALRFERMLRERGVAVEPGFAVERVDGRALVSGDGRRIPFDLLVTVPVNMGAEYVARSGLGDEHNCVPVNPRTFLATGYRNIFALGDAADLPTAKTGSAAHFSVDVFAANFLDHIAGRAMTRRFDGHSHCIVECGRGRAVSIDFGYDAEPMPGRVGPLPLLRESAVNHWGKLAVRWLYWNVLLPGRHLALPRRTGRWSPRPLPHAPATPRRS